MLATIVVLKVLLPNYIKMCTSTTTRSLKAVYYCKNAILNATEMNMLGRMEGAEHLNCIL